MSNSVPYGTLRDIANELKNIREILEKQSTTEQSPKVGEWLLDGRCSECLIKPLTTHKNYCPNCGAKMKGARDYERAIERMEHDALYEPTYNSEDGSM